MICLIHSYVVILIFALWYHTVPLRSYKTCIFLYKRKLWEEFHKIKWKQRSNILQKSNICACIRCEMQLDAILDANVNWLILKIRLHELWWMRVHDCFFENIWEFTSTWFKWNETLSVFRTCKCKRSCRFKKF